MGQPTHLLSNFDSITSPTRQQNPITSLDRRRHNMTTTHPSSFGALGPTAITVASGSGLDVVDVGRNIPIAVF